MASSSETGNAKNVANFDLMLSFVSGYGGRYNPTKASIQLPSMTALKANAEAAVKAVTTTYTTYKNTTNDRQVAFEPLKQLATQVVNALAATDATKEMIDDARTINRKIQGSRKGSKTADATPPVDPTPPNPVDPVVPDDKTISVSQQSYDAQVDNFFKLIELVKSEPSYNPNEIELQVGTLATMENDMRNKNKAVADAIAAIGNARIARNTILYQDKTGLYDVQLDVKKYVLSVYKTGSSEYKQISGIRFTKPR